LTRCDSIQTSNSYAYSPTWLEKLRRNLSLLEKYTRYLTEVKELSQQRPLDPAQAITDPVMLANLYRSINLSPGQTKFVQSVAELNTGLKQHVAKVLRGGGKSMCAGIGCASAHRQDPTLRIFVLAGSFWQAKRLYRHYMPLVTNPQFFPQEWIIGEPSQSLTQFVQGGSMEILTSSPMQSRAGHVDWLIIDEAVLVKSTLIDAVWAVVRTSRRPKRIVMSTASAEVNLEWFLRLWQDAGRMKFQRHEWPLEECPWISEEDTEAARLMLDSQTYRIEYLGEIGERRGRVFDNIFIDGAEGSNKPKAIVDPRRAEEYPLPQQPPLTEWAGGLDWGFTHPTVLTVGEKQGETVYTRDCRIWQNESFTEIRQEIKEDYGHIPIHADSSSPGENNDLTKLGVKVVPVIFSKRKADLISHVRWRLENGFWKIPDPEVDRRFFTLVQQMKAYHYDDQGKPVKVNDDAVDSALCLMDHFASRFKPSARFVTI
jgi:hypothetical protein